MLTVEVRDVNLTPVGVIDTFTSLTYTEIWMGVGGWILDLDPTSPAVDELLRPGAGIIVRDTDGTIVYSGPVGIGVGDAPTARRDRSVGDGDTDSLTIVGNCDNVHIADRQAHPSPRFANPAEHEHDVRRGKASTVMLAYISANLGADAVASRRVRGLTFEVDPHAGADVVGRARWQNLLEFLAGLADGAGVQIRQKQRGVLEVSAIPVTDLSADVVFSVDYGNVVGYTYEQAPSVANAIYMAGQGEGTARAIVEASTPSVRRIEAFSDRRDVADVSELAGLAATELRELVGTTSLTIVPSETETLVYGFDYRLGDIVTVVVDDVRIVGQIRAVETTLSVDGLARQFTVGATAPVGIHALFAALRRMSRRVAQLERI